MTDHYSNGTTKSGDAQSNSTGLRDRATQTLDGARSTAGDAAQKASDAIATNPLAVLAGGLVVGVVAGALLPRSERERAALDQIGRRLSEGAAAALAAAKDTGKERLNASMLSGDAAKEGARAIFGSAVTAAKEAGTADQPQTANVPQAPTVA